VLTPETKTHRLQIKLAVKAPSWEKALLENHADNELADMANGGQFVPPFVGGSERKNRVINDRAVVILVRIEKIIKGIVALHLVRKKSEGASERRFFFVLKKLKNPL
jgi:hypothetical protein